MTTGVKTHKESIIKYGWGTMFDYSGEMLHGLNKYNLIVGIEIPRIDGRELKEIPFVHEHFCNQFEKKDVSKGLCDDMV